MALCCFEHIAVAAVVAVGKSEQTTVVAVVAVGKTEHTAVATIVAVCKPEHTPGVTSSHNHFKAQTLNLFAI